MERKTRKKLAAVLVFFMLFSILPTAVFAAPAEQNQGIELQPYTSMEDLIQKAKAELIADGHVMETEPVNAVLVDDVESQTGRSFGEVKTAISQGLITDYETGVIDLERYGLSKDTLQDLMEYVLQQNYLVDDVTYSYDIQNGKIHFDMSEGKMAAFDSWNAMRESATNNTATQNAVASVKVGKGVKAEGNLIIAGTKGYIYVPAPWWKTDYFEIRYENQEENKRYFYQLDGEGIRYQIVAFIRSIESKQSNSYISQELSEKICSVIEEWNEKKDLHTITV